MTHDSKTKEANIHINDVHFRVGSDEMTGAELKALGGISPANRLFKEVHGPADDVPIPDHEAVHLHNGDRFYDIAPGTKGEGSLPLPREQLERLQQDHPDLTAKLQPDGAVHLLVPGVRIRPGWTKEQTDILVLVPAGYPQNRPQGFFCDQGLALSSGQGAGGRSEQSLEDRTWAYFCWHPNSWEPERETLLRYLRFCISRFEDLS